jgi:hypothetical protein
VRDQVSHPYKVIIADISFFVFADSRLWPCDSLLSVMFIAIVGVNPAEAARPARRTD